MDSGQTRGDAIQTHVSLLSLTVTLAGAIWPLVSGHAAMHRP